VSDFQSAEKISKMEEEAGKYTEEQLAEIMLDFSGMTFI
jgi:hypothetical protein